MSIETTTDRIAIQSTDKLVKATQGIEAIVSTLKTAVTEHEDLVYKIAERQQELEALAQTIKETQRRATVELDIALRADALSKATEIATNQGKTIIDTAKLTQLQNDFLDLTDSFEVKLSEATDKIRADANASTSAQVQRKELELKVQEANNLAAITSLKAENEILKTQAATYLRQLDAERTARVQEAQARGNPSVVVNSGK